MRTATVALLLVLAACGRGSDDPRTAATTPEPTSEADGTATPTIAPPTGVPAPQALTKFRCSRTPKGIWNSSGYVVNDTKGSVTYQVTVYVGGAAGSAEKAKTRRVPDVAAGGSAKFVVNNVPAIDPAGPCHVQVLAQR